MITDPIIATIEHDNYHTLLKKRALAVRMCLLPGFMDARVPPSRLCGELHGPVRDDQLDYLAVSFLSSSRGNLAPLLSPSP